MWFISKHNSRSDPSGQIIISSDQWDHVLLIMGWLVGEIEEWISITSILYMDIISTCYKSECGGTVVQQVWFEQPRDRLSEVVDCHLALEEISNKNDHLSQYETKNKCKSHKCIWGTTCFISDSDDRSSTDPHALRVDHRVAQKSCNGAIYCRAALLQHIPGKQSSYKWSCMITPSSQTTHRAVAHTQKHTLLLYTLTLSL